MSSNKDKRGGWPDPVAEAEVLRELLHDARNRLILGKQ
jgi:hypothetical protein